MSAHSSPSLISDSSSLSISSHLGEVAQGHISQRASLTAKPTASIHLPTKDSQKPEVRHLSSRVSKLGQDSLVLGEYAAELQSRIPQLECERMDQQDPINDSQQFELVGHAESNACLTAVVPTSRPSSPIHNTYSTPPSRSSLHRPSSSLSAVTSTAAKRVLARSSPRGTPSSSSSQLAFPFSSRIKLVPRRSPRVEAPEPITSPQSEPSVSRRPCEYESTTPTRRRLQAMYGLFSSESSPSLGEGEPIQNGLDGHESNGPQRACSVRAPHSKGLPRDNALVEEAKRPKFTSKLDSIILTSKLFPLPSSRSKAPLSTVSPDHCAPTSHTAVIPLARATTSSIPHAGNIFLDSPPNKNVKVQLPSKGHNLLSQSLGLEENRHPNMKFRSTDRKLAPKSRGRVSFSDRLFFSPSDRGDETDTDIERAGRMWGSWSRKKRPPPLSFTKEKPTSSPPSPLSAFSRLSRSHGERSGDSDDQRRGKRTSLAPGCLRTLVSSGDRDKAAVDVHRDRHVPRRSHSESRGSASVARSHSGRSAPSSRRSEDGEHSANVRSKDNKKRITPSRVGSPMPKSRLPELQGGELERTSSMRSAGKWGHRGTGFSAELTRRRTIHPMFSFERPGSIEAASTSSSKRGDRADDEATGDERRGPANKSRQLSRPAVSPSIPPARLPHHGADASQSQATHTQGHSEPSGHSGGSGLTRPDPGLAGKIPMMRTRVGMQSHGTFAFEPAAAVVCSPRSVQPVGTDRVRGGVNSTRGSLLQRKGVPLVRSFTDTHGGGQGSSKPQDGPAVDKEAEELEYLEFCKELKVVLGGGEDWSSFKKYVRRFDLEVLSAEVLLQRVKKLLDGRRSVDSATRLRLYERFVKAVHDNMNE